MSGDRRSLAERIARSRARLVAPEAPASETGPKEDAGGRPVESGSPLEGIGSEAPPPQPASADADGHADGKAARLRKVRELVRATERGWRESLPAEGAAVREPPHSYGASPRPALRTPPPALRTPLPALPGGPGWPESSRGVLRPPAGRARPEAPFSHEDHDFPLGAPYGGATLLGLREAGEQATARLQMHPGEPGVDLSRTLFLDTETSGLAGGTGTFAFLIGLGRVEGTRFRVTQLLLRDPSREGAMLEALAALAADGRDLVTYNGASFDLPLLETRFALNGLGNPLAGLRHLDLLHPARRLFRPRHENARLGVLERELLGVERDDDIPGDRIPQVFFHYLRNGPHPAMESVLSHNRYDIRTLAALSLRAVEFVADGWSSDDPAYLHGAGHHFFRRGEAEAAIPLLERALAAGLSGRNRDRCLLDLGEHRKRRGDWEGAIGLWRRVGEGDTREKLDALVWFAKWDEHRRKDPARALEHVEDALERLPRAGMRREAAANYRSRLEKRARRLRAKRG